MDEDNHHAVAGVMAMVEDDTGCGDGGGDEYDTNVDDGAGDCATVLVMMLLHWWW